jgi:hypothetical protein
MWLYLPTAAVGRVDENDWCRRAGAGCWDWSWNVELQLAYMRAEAWGAAASGLTEHQASGNCLQRKSNRRDKAGSFVDVWSYWTAYVLIEDCIESVYWSLGSV